MSARRESLLAAGALLLVLLGLFHRPIFLGEVFHREDLGAAYVPVQVENARRRAEGELPLWNPYLLVGFPISAEPESGGLYPPALIFNLPVGNGVALTLYVLLHLIVAALGAGFLAGRFGLSPIARGVAAMVFVFSGAFVAQIVNLTLITTAAWLPLILGLLHRSIAERRVRPVVVAGLIFGISLLGAQPQISLYTMMFGGLLALLPPGDGPYRRRLGWGIGALAGIAVLGVLVALPQLVHTASWITEIDVGGAPGGTEGSSAYQFVTLMSHPPQYFLQLLVPGLYGSYAEDGWVGVLNSEEQTSYLGLVTLGLAAIGWRRAPHVLRVALVAGVILALGCYAGVYHLLVHVPLLNMFRNPARWLLVLGLVVGLLAGFGYDGLRAWLGDGVRRRRRLTIGYAALVPLLLGLAFVLDRAATEPGGAFARAYDAYVALDLEHNPWRQVDDGMLRRAAGFASRSAMWAAAMAALTALWWWRAERGRPGPATGLALLALLGLDLGIASRDFHAYERPDLHDRPTPMYAALAPGPLQPRLHGDDLQTDRQALYRVPGLSAFVSRVHPRVDEFLDQLETFTLAKAAAAHVGHWIEAPGLGPPLPASLAAAVASTTRIEHWGVLHHLDPARLLGRAHLVERERVIADDDDAAAWLAGASFDPWHEVVVPRPSAGLAACRAAAREAVGLAPGVAFEAYRPERVVIRARAPRCSLLVLSDLYFRGWTATVDGAAVELGRGDHIFRAVPVPPGEHVVELRYWPRGMTAGLAVSALALLGALGWLAWSWRRPGAPRAS